MKAVRSMIPLLAAMLTAATTSYAQPLTSPKPSSPTTPSPPAEMLWRALDSSPQSTNSHFKSAMDRQIVELRKKTRDSGAGADVWSQLGNALMQKSRENLDGRVYEQAKAAYHKAVSLDPRSEEALVGLTWVYNSEHQFEEGRRWAEKALAINPKSQHAHALLGDAAVELGDYDQAFEHYQKALDVRPDLSSYSRAAHLLWLTGDARKARWLMQKAIDAGGPYVENTAWCRAELARMLWNEGAVLAAEQQAEMAVLRAPKNPQVLATMGKIKAARKEYEAAIDFYKRAIGITPTHDALVALGDLYALTGRREEAEKQYRRVVEFHTSGDAHSHGGSVHVHSQNHGNAQLARFYADHDQNLDDALCQAELAYGTFQNVFGADTLAWCYYKKGLYAEARKIIRKALRWKTPDANILFHAGMIHAKLGDRGSAQKFLYQALNLNPNFDPIHAPVAADTIKELSAPAIRAKEPPQKSSTNQ